MLLNGLVAKISKNALKLHQRHCSTSTSKRRVVEKLGKVSPTLLVPPEISRPPYALATSKSTKTYQYWMRPVEIMTTESLPKMKKACKLARQVLNFAGSLVKPGITTDEIDKQVHKMIIYNGAYPSPLQYQGFPKSICTSINNVVAHGIPDDQSIHDGDIINIDITVYLNGYHGDCSETFLVGNVDGEIRRLVDAARTARDLGISLCKPGEPICVIGNAIEEYTKKMGYTLAPDLTGHGIGQHFHTNPLVYNCKNKVKDTMKPGMTFTVEPALCIGSGKWNTAEDGWTLLTRDEGFSALFEHTILITDDGHEILTI